MKIIDRYIELNSLIKQLTDEKDEIKNILLSQLPPDLVPGDKFQMDKLTFAARQQHDLDQEKTQAALQDKALRNLLIEGGAVVFKPGKNKELASKHGLLVTTWTAPSITIKK
jgi:riboflavin biosynthesis pyrimidine reductase